MRCSSGCKYYEIDNVALSKMESTDFPAIKKSALLKTVREVANRGGEAEIVFDGTTITAREKQS